MATRKNNKIGKFFSIILLIFSLVFLGTLFYSNMIPFKFLLPITIVIGLLTFVLFCLLRKRRLKKRVFITSLLLLIIEGVISYYILITLGFLNKLMPYDYKTSIYDVIVLKDSNYNKINDLENKVIGYYDDDSKENKEALNKLNKKIDFEDVPNKDIDILFEMLYDNNIQAVFIEDSKYKILGEEDHDLRNTTKVIGTITIKTKLQANKADKKNILKEPFNVYITGNDEYGKITNTGRSDVNILATVNIKEGKVLFTSIPRDYYVTLADKSEKDKLTHAGIYGVDTSIKTIEGLLDTKINYYVKINFTSVEDIIDVLGGITINSDYSFTSKDGYYYKKGPNKLNGKKTLSYVRERKAFGDMGGDRVRGEHQLQVIKELVNKVTSPSILTKYQSILDKIEGKFTTDFSEKNIAKIVKNQLDKNTKWQIESYSLEGTDGREKTYSYPSKSLYVMIPNEDSIKLAKEKINEYLGE
jgi:LCP family protein required for cell wall assembly